MIRFDRASKRYPNGREGLHAASLEIAAGEMVFLTGRSGAGKSTILKLITLLERPTRGLVMVNSCNTAALSSRRPARSSNTSLKRMARAGSPRRAGRPTGGAIATGCTRRKGRTCPRSC